LVHRERPIHHIDFTGYVLESRNCGLTERAAKIERE